MPADDVELPVTASFGVATYDAPNKDFAMSLGRADRALYRAKADGRNRVATAVATEPA
jgi:diguanylate cyclase (GGDEF)-like protein